MRRYLHLFFITLVLLSLVITSLFPSQAVSASPVKAPTITFSMTDTLIDDGAGPVSPDDDGDSKADSAETIEYTAVISNGGADPATGVTFHDILDLNTTLVGGSLNVSPLALDDSYTTIGNTLLDVGILTSDPAVHVTTSSIDNLFDNDIEFLGDNFTLLSVEADMTAPFTTTSEQGGSVTVESDGNFSYLPMAGFSGIDNFDYVITDDGPDNIPGNTDDLTGAGRVMITVTPEKVWYVKNDAAPGGSGRSTDPFDTLVEAETASSANDTIYVFQGNSTTTGQNAGITLKNGQRLLGEGVALAVPVGVNGGSNPTTLRAAGSQPLIDNTSGVGVSVPDSSNVQIFGLNIAGSTNAVNVTTTATNSGGFELANNTIRSAGGNAIDVNAGGSGTLTVSLHDNIITSTGNGIDIQRTAGSVNVIAFDDNVVHGNTTGTGINIVGTGATVLFDANPATAAFDTVSAGVTLIGQSGNRVGQSGLVLNNIRGDLSFTDLDVYVDNGTALLVNGTSPNYTGTSGTRVVASSSSPVLSAIGGPAVNLTDVSVNLVLSSLSSTNSTTTGVSLFKVAGTFSAPSGSSITNATGVDFSINGNNNASANVGLSYAGTITDTSGMLVQIQNVTASSNHTFTGSITDNGGTSTGISLTGNSGATISFSGGLSLSTGQNPAFTATGGGTVNVCDENPCNSASTGSLVNALTTTTGTALNISNTAIGSNDLEFRSISANGATNGIVLNTTGSSGGLMVKGNGTADSGGIIQNTTGSGIVATNTQDLSLTRIKILNAGTHGIDASDLRGTSLVSNSTIQDWVSATGNGINLVNNNTNLTLLTVSATTFNGTATSNDGIFMEAQGSSSMALSVENGSVFTDMFGDGVQVNGITGATGAVNVTIKNSTFNNAAALGNGGISLQPFGAVTFNATVDGNTFDTLMRPVTNLGAIGGTNGLTANTTLKIKNNTLNNIIGSRGITFSADGTGLTTLLIDNNSIDRLGSTSKYAIQVNMIGAAGIGSPGNVTVANNQIGQEASLWTGGNGNAEAIYLLTQNSSTMTSLVSGNLVTANANLEVIRARAIGASSQNLTVMNNTLTDSYSTHIGELAGRTEGSAALCMNAFANTLPGGGVILLSESAGTMNITQASSAALASANSGATVSTSGTPAFGQPACVTPPVIAMGPNDNFVMHNQSDTLSDVVARTANSDLTIANSINTTENTGQTTAGVLDGTIASSSAGVSSGKPLFSPVPAPTQSGETVGPIIIGTLPVGKSVTIQFRVTVNDPVSTSRILNKGNVTYTGGPDGGVNTTDPSPNADPACNGTGTQTCTPVDRPDTTVTSINRTASSPSNADSVSWTITFAHAVSGLTSSNFTLANAGLGGSPAITSVTAVGGTPALQWTVSASTGTGQGTLGLNMTSDMELSHDVTGLSVTGQIYDIDTIVPTTTSFTSQSPSTTPTNSDVLVYRVTFSEAIGGTGGSIGPEDFAVSGTTATVTSVAFVSTGVYDVEVSGGDLTGFNGVVGLNFSAGMVIRDLAGNDVPNTEPTTDETYTVDNAAPGVTLSSTLSDPTNTNPVPVTVQFSEDITGFSEIDIVAGNATVSNFTAVDGDTYTFDLTPSDQGLVTADVAAGVAVDAVGNGNTVAAQFSRTFDSNAPTVAITSSAADPTNTSPIPVTVQFSEIVSGFTASDITAGNATVGSFNIVDGDTYTFDLTPSGQGVVTVDIDSGLAQDSSGNGNSTSSQFSRTFDSDIPTVVMTSAASDPTNVSPIFVTAQFSESVTGFIASDITVNNATVGNFNVVDSDTYIFELSPIDDGLVTADIPATVATDGVNLNSAAAQFSRSFDSDAPTATMTSTAPDPTNTSPILLTVQFSENVTGFTLGDITPEKATVGNFIAVDGDTYTFDLTPLADGLVTADIAAGVAQDSSGNLSNAASQFSRTFDTLAPSVTINQAVGQGDPTSTSPVNFTVVFSEPVTDFATGDVELSSSTATGTLTGTVSGGPTTYNVAVSGMNSDGMVIASISADVATDGANLNTASTSTDDNILYVANPMEHVISGNVGIGGVVLSYLDGTVKTAISQADGGYSFQVSFNWTGTVTPTHTCYTFNPVSQNYSNVITDQTTQDYTSTFNTSSSCADVDLSIAGAYQGQFVLPPQENTQTSVAGLNNGLVKLESTNTQPIIGSEQVVYKVKGNNVSFSEMMGLPDSELDTTYWLPWYNNVGLDTQLRFGNVSGSTATVRVFIGAVEMEGSPFTLLPNQSTRVSFAGVNDGPVKIESDQNIVAAERFIYKVQGTQTSFSEMIALPNSQLDTTYWLPWYNNVHLDTQLRFANVTNQPASVRIFIAGEEMEGSPFHLAPGESTRKSFSGINDGPVQIVSDQKIVAAERVIYKANRVNTSFSEMLALPNNQLDTTYWFPQYNNVDLDTQLRLANVSGSTATVHVYVSGVEMSGSPFTLLPHQSIQVSFSGVNNGPVKVESDQAIVVAKRVIYEANGIPTSYSEIMGLPESLLNPIYWFPWYNNVDLDTRLRFVVP